MLSAVRKFGNSAGVIIPKPLLSEIGAEAGDRVEMRVEGSRLVIEKIASHPRAGWAEDAMRVAAADEAPAWPDFANDDDDALKW